MKRKYVIVGGVSALSICAILFAALAPVVPKFVWNASMSAPIGLYRIEEEPPGLGDYALVEPSDCAAKLIEERDYLPPKTPLIKRIAALSGDEICRDGEAVFINGDHIADALRFDSLGRNMPAWEGCFVLSSDEVFLLNTHEKSLDGRYFGATKSNQIIGVAIPVL